MKIEKLSGKLEIKAEAIFIDGIRVAFRSFDYGNLICVDEGFLAKVKRKGGLGYIEFYKATD